MPGVTTRVLRRILTLSPIDRLFYLSQTGITTIFLGYT